MERINAALLPFAEQFGTRNQDYALSEVIVPTRDTQSDIFGSLRLAGADNTSAVIGVAATVNLSVRVEADTYVTGIWFQEPNGAQDGLVVNEAFVLRNQGAGFSQVTPLWFKDNNIMGAASAWRRTWQLQGWPWGALMRSGDLISMTVHNPTASATTTGIVLGYRGFVGPPP